LPVAIERRGFVIGIVSEDTRTTDKSPTMTSPSAGKRRMDTDVVKL